MPRLTPEELRRHADLWERLRATSIPYRDVLIIEAAEAGMPLVDIAAACKIHRVTVSNIVRNYRAGKDHNE